MRNYRKLFIFRENALGNTFLRFLDGNLLWIWVYLPAWAFLMFLVYLSIFQRVFLKNSVFFFFWRCRNDFYIMENLRRHFSLFTILFKLVLFITWDLSKNLNIELNKWYIWYIYYANRYTMYLPITRSRSQHAIQGKGKEEAQTRASGLCT